MSLFTVALAITLFYRYFVITQNFVFHTLPCSLLMTVKDILPMAWLSDFAYPSFFPLRIMKVTLNQ